MATESDPDRFSQLRKQIHTLFHLQLLREKTLNLVYNKETLF
jgi:hypothetical protein